ncbi:MAG TPA: bacillithiol biosynthesis deacetylase BshB1 [Vicinamibacterales bacterium]|nr:bacillithiol biosynthesis deacetylase BshB1 [Vicinamibacterales bacterium]
MTLDLLVFGPHPDDLELGLGGTIARETAAGRVVGLCDLTAGELGTNGTPDIRLAEADEAARLLGAAWRVNLGWPDGHITASPAAVDAVVTLVRTHRPATIAIPYWQDRHPDHRAASQVLDEAIFKAGLLRYAPDLPPWRPSWVCYYFINDGASPSFVVDVSEHYDRKRAALACHRSQFTPAGADAAPTRLTAPTFRQLIESRDAQFGALSGVLFAEGVVVREPVSRPSLRKDLP